MKELKGVICALCTPMTNDGSAVDEGALKAHIDSMIEAGINGILVCGGTGEFPMLSIAERRRITEVASRHIAGRVVFMAHASAIATAEAIESARHAEANGADAILLLPPYFEGPDADGVYDHFERVAAAVRTPFMIYNIPVHSGFDVTPEFFLRLSRIDNIRYIKDSTGNLLRIQDLIDAGIRVFNGGDPIMFHALLAGAPGAVWGGANAMPREGVKLFELVAAGRLGEALALWKTMLPANKFFWTHVYNASVKAATNMTGRHVGPCRPPVRPLKAEELAELRQAMSALSAKAEPKAAVA
jgi:4-hydroxy-tetrahydrodipicolinate synthase